MPTCARVGADSAGGTQLGGGNSFVTSDGLLIVVLGDAVEPHNRRQHRSSPHMVEGSSFVTINGIPICREGDQASCGHSTTGSGVLTSA